MALSGVVALGDDRVEPEAVEVVDERLQRRREGGVAGGPAGAFGLADGEGVGGLAPSRSAIVQHHPGEHRHGRRFEAERRRLGGERVAVLRAADLAAAVGRDVEQADLAHPVEVRAHRVGVQAQRLGDLRRAQRTRRRASSR